MSAKSRERWWQSRAIQAAILTGVIALAVAIVGLWKPEAGGVYRVRATVLDPSGTPVDKVRVWSSMPGEPQQVAGGWEFNIPAESRPADGKLTIFAAKPAAFLSGQAELQLGGDWNPTVTVRLTKDGSASVTGMVQDAQGRALAGVRVSVIGKPNSVITGADGGFVLDIGAADGEMVQLHAEKAGYGPVTQSHLAGDEPAVLVLDAGVER